ncbi:MAG: DUF1080 domain-containing protein [Bacteroidia bacterium]
MNARPTILRRYWPVLPTLLALVWACSTPKPQQTEAEPAALADSAWVVLFDGTSLDGWRNYRADTLSPAWQIEDGTLALTGPGGGDLITDKAYGGFELELEWKISEGGNSGLIYLVQESDSLSATYFSGPEMQILDDAAHADADPKHLSGANYDMHPCTEPAVKPAGAWNSVRLVVDHGKVEHWLNGKQVVAYEIGSPDWEARLQQSKFTEWPAYGRATQGHIALQDHGNKVWFRNIRIREM